MHSSGPLTGLFGARNPSVRDRCCVWHEAFTQQAFERAHTWPGGACGKGHVRHTQWSHCWTTLAYATRRRQWKERRAGTRRACHRLSTDRERANYCFFRPALGSERKKEIRRPKRSYFQLGFEERGARVCVSPKATCKFIFSSDCC